MRYAADAVKPPSWLIVGDDVTELDYRGFQSPAIRHLRHEVTPNTRIMYVGLKGVEHGKPLDLHTYILIRKPNYTGEKMHGHLPTVGEFWVTYVTKDGVTPPALGPYHTDTEAWKVADKMHWMGCTNINVSASYKEKPQDEKR